jgi:hypothetical protein
MKPHEPKNRAKRRGEKKGKTNDNKNQIKKGEKAIKR